MSETLPLRNAVPEELKWDLTLLYPDEASYQADVAKLRALAEELYTYRGRLTDASSIGACLDLYENYTALRNVLNSYAVLAVSVDYTDESNLEREGVLSGIINELESRLTFIESELSQLDLSVLNQAALDPRHAGFLSRIIRRKPHLLHPEAECALAAMSRIMQAPYTVYEQLKLSDTKFPPFTVNGQTYPLDYSLFEDDYEYDARTDVRRAAFHAFSRSIAAYENGIAAAYNAEVCRQKAEADLRGFDSVFDFLLFDQHVTREMYDRQIDNIMEKLSLHMRRFARLIQRTSGLQEMTFADLKAPIDPTAADSITIDRAHSDIREALSILGPDYIDVVDRAFSERWIDFARNTGKSTGGFCDSPYGKNSYILMTWNGRMSDAFTLAHELGHAGHFASCNSAQSVFDTDVSTYFVEAPSTMNELIFGYSMLDRTTDDRTRRLILSRMVGDTLYHNFVTHGLEAAYQREVYRIIDAGGSVHAASLNRIMKETLQKFWGDAVLIDDDAARTWMRQPHYYMGLYSYTYSAGLTVALNAAQRIRTEGAPAVEDWKKVLAAGSTLDPVGLAKLAGIDITTDRALLNSIDLIGSMIDEIELLTDRIEAAQ